MFGKLHNLSHHAAWRKQLEMLLDSAGEGIYGIDLRGRCVFINRRGAELLGYTQDEMFGRNMHYLIHHSYANRALMPVCECHIFKAFQDGKGCRVDNEVLWRRDGSSFHAEYVSHPIIEEGTIQGAVVTFSDITERVLAQQVLARSHADLEKLVEQRTVELKQAHDRMRGLTAHLNSVREKERIRIARDLHDDMGTRLTAMNLQLNSLAHATSSDANIQERLQTILSMNEEAMTSLRAVLSDLRPGVLDHLGLWAALEHLAADARLNTHAEIECQLDETIEGVRLDRAAETALYRMVQEALNNAIKHAVASHIQISAKLGSQGLVLQVRDDGRGYNVRPGKGYGLLGIEERAHAIGASCKIESRAGKGVLIRLCVPVVQLKDANEVEAGL